MSQNAKILIDLAVLAAAYGIWLLPKWRPAGEKTAARLYAHVWLPRAGIVLFTLMPVLAALPFADHPYIPIHMAPFEDVILHHGDYVRQIVLNVILFVPFGVLQPLCDRCRGKRCSFWRCLLLTLALSAGIESCGRCCMFSWFGYYGRHHEHDRRRAGLCALGDRARLLKKKRQD